jgi:hypothetical protein
VDTPARVDNHVARGVDDDATASAEGDVGTDDYVDPSSSSTSA